MHFDHENPSNASLSRRGLLVACGLVVGACTSSRRRAGLHGARSAPLVYDDHGGLFVDALVEGFPARLIVDTGASQSALSTAFASRLSSSLGADTVVEGSAGEVHARTLAADVEIPGLDRARLDCTVYEFASYDPLCVGILGSDYLRRAPFRIRYRDRRLEWNATGRGASLDLELDNGIPRIRARIGDRAVDLRVDTGAAFPPGPDSYFNLTLDQASELGLVGPPHAVFTATGTGNAVLDLKVYVLDRVVLAGRDIPRAFAIVQPRVGYFARSDAVGFVGNSVLDKLDPFFDYAAGKFELGD